MSNDDDEDYQNEEDIKKSENRFHPRGSPLPPQRPPADNSYWDPSCVSCMLKPCSKHAQLPPVFRRAGRSPLNNHTGCTTNDVVASNMPDLISTTNDMRFPYNAGRQALDSSPMRHLMQPTVHQPTGSPQSASGGDVISPSRSSMPRYFPPPIPVGPAVRNRRVENHVTSMASRTNQAIPNTRQMTNEHTAHNIGVSWSSIEEREQENLIQFSWFSLTLTSADAEDKVRMLGEDGSFVVRRSSSGGVDYPYAITFIHRDNTYHMYVRRRPEDGHFALGNPKPNEAAFPSLHKLIRHYTTNWIILDVRGPDNRVKLKYSAAS